MSMNVGLSGLNIDRSWKVGRSGVIGLLTRVSVGAESPCGWANGIMVVWARIRRGLRSDSCDALDTIFQLNRPDEIVIGVVKKSCARFSIRPRNEAVLLVFMVEKQTLLCSVS